MLTREPEEILDLVEALTGQFDEHHAELARMLLDQIDALTAQIDTLTARIDTQLAAILDTRNPDPDHPDPDHPDPTRTTPDPDQPIRCRRQATAPATSRKPHPARHPPFLRHRSCRHPRRDPRSGAAHRAGHHRRDRA